MPAFHLWTPRRPLRGMTADVRTVGSLLTLILLATACGEKSNPPTPGTDEPPPAASEPAEPPPTMEGTRSIPPPAWIETRRSKRWLAFYSYCWSTTCVDSMPAEQRTDVPQITVEQNEVVRFHLRFEPSELTLRVGTEEYRLPARQTVGWRVTGRGGFLLLTAKGSPGTAGYLARIRIG